MCVCSQTGLSAHRGGLAEDPDGAIAGHQPPRRHEDLAQVRQPVRKERAPGQCLKQRGAGGGLDVFSLILSFFFLPAPLDPDRRRVNCSPITFRKNKSEMIEISLVSGKEKMEVGPPDKVNCHLERRP